MSYDSKADTLEHIQNVRNGIGWAISELVYRCEIHDQSKLSQEEKLTFDEFTPKLRGSTYGSEEYRSFLTSMGPALAHHYASNRHHPEHFGELGIRGMNLIDALEMVIDWHAATKRHDDGNLHKSIDLSQSRFGYSEDLKAMMHNTADWLLAADARERSGK